MGKPKKVPLSYLLIDGKKELPVCEYFKLYAKVSTWKGHATVEKNEEKKYYSIIIESKSVSTISYRRIILFSLMTQKMQFKLLIHS